MKKQEAKIMVCILESVNLENYTGVFKFKQATPKNAPWTKVNVALSGLLKSMIEREDHKGLNLGDTFVGTEFRCPMNSPNYSDNPFKLIRFEPIKNSDIPVNYRLELVNQRRDNKRVELKDIFDQKYEFWYNKRRRFTSDKFMRSIVMETEELMKNLQRPIVKP